jgi:hypothetical protein
MSASRSSRSRRELVADVIRGLSPAQERRELLQLLDAEVLATQVYALAAGAGPISPAGRALATHLGAQEQSHAAALGRLAGPPIPLPPASSPGAVERSLGQHGISVTFGSLHSERQWFTLLEELERAMEGVYFQALGRLSNPSHALLAARILASEAQHSTLLFSFRNPQNIQLDVAEGQIRGRAR